MEYIVILIAAVFHAIWNSIIKDSDDKLLTLTGIRLIGFLFGICVIFFFPPMEKAAISYLAVAVFIHFLYFWFLLNTYRVGDFSQVYPISRGSAPLIVLLFGIVYAKESLSPAQLGATLLICSGILLLSLAKTKPSLIPVAYSIATAICIAGYTVASGMGVRMTDSFIVYSGWLEATTGFGVILFTVLKRKRQVFVYAKTQWKVSICAGILSVSAYAAALWAMKRAPLAPIAAVRETSIVFAAIIGIFILKEGFGAIRIFSACIVVAGIAILTIFS